MKGATAFIKDTFLAILLISLAVLTLPQNAFAQESPQWHLPEGATARLGKGSINEIAYSPDSTRLAVASRIGIWMYDTETGEALDLLAPNTGVESVSFSPDGQISATVNGGFRVHLRHATTGERLQTIRGVRRNSYLFMPDNVVFSPDGNTLAGGGSDGIVRLWDIKTGTERQIPTGDYGGLKVAFSPDGNTLGTVPLLHIGGPVLLWDVNTGKQLREFTADGSGLSRIFSMAFSPDGNTLATGSGDYDHIEGSFGTVTLWDVNTGETLQTLTGHAHKVSSISFSPDGSRLATGSRDGTVLLWELTPFLPEPERITADINADGTVNVQDLVLVSSHLGNTGENVADVNGDGVVNILDLTLVAKAIGSGTAK